MIKKVLLKKSLYFFSLLFSISAYAGNSNISLLGAFEQLKDLDQNYKIVGTVCEQVTNLELKEAFPDHLFLIKNGIKYRIVGSRNFLGELDTVIFDRASRKALYVFEVKCRKNSRRALHEARRQLSRFYRTLKAHVPLDFISSENDNVYYSSDQFDESLVTASVSYEGSHFNLTLGFSLEELMGLRQQLIEYKLLHGVQ
jgi:hypothetical protein